MASQNLTDEQAKELDRLLRFAHLMKMRSQWKEAEDTCRKALAISPNDAGIYEMLGDILWERGKLDDATLQFKTAMQLAPGKASPEEKYAKTILEKSEAEREKAIALEMLENPQKYPTRQKNPAVAFILSAVFPGLGQFYNGDVAKAGIIFALWMAALFAAAASIGGNKGLASLANPVTLIFGFIALMIQIYAMVDAPFVAYKLTKKAKEPHAHLPLTP
ncbi:MAG: DUF5683 domain-containing protein [Armatimonadota bacterium]|jgi:TM2 domain-containing membrane protein YozV